MVDIKEIEKARRLLKYSRKIRRVGNSDVVTIPSDVLEQFGASAGDTVLIRGLKKKRKHLIELEWFG